jgi:nitrite reductase (NADH) small subunit/3-phenylpropionate/trans-cinnamate dioxygenase ferredoxin subunit
MCHVESRQPDRETKRVRPLRADALGEGEGLVVDAGGRWLAIFRTGGEIFAIDNACPHAGGPLGAGRLDGCVVTCPLHGWRIDLRSGRSPDDERAAVARYETWIEGEWIVVALPS